MSEGSPSGRGQALLEGAADSLAECSRALEAYLELLSEVAGQAAGEEPFLAWLKGQRERTQSLLELLDREALDGLIRVADRNVRLRHREDGRFV